MYMNLYMNQSQVTLDYFTSTNDAPADSRSYLHRAAHRECPAARPTPRIIFRKGGKIILARYISSHLVIIVW